MPMATVLPDWCAFITAVATLFKSFAASMAGSEERNAEKEPPFAGREAKSVTLTLLFLSLMEYVLRPLEEMGLNFIGDYLVGYKTINKAIRAFLSAYTLWIAYERYWYKNF